MASVSVFGIDFIQQILEQSGNGELQELECVIERLSSYEIVDPLLNPVVEFLFIGFPKLLKARFRDRRVISLVRRLFDTRGARRNRPTVNLRYDFIVDRSSELCALLFEVPCDFPIGLRNLLDPVSHLHDEIVVQIFIPK